MFKILNYISPSSFFMYRGQPYTFFLKKMLDPSPIPRDPQGLPASVGTAFDISIKEWLLLKKLVTSEIPLETIHKSLETNHEEAMAEGYRLRNLYLGSGIISRYKWKTIEIHHQKEVEGVPLLGQLDCTYEHPIYGETVLDWKVNGYVSGASPCPTYRDIYDTSKRTWKGKYKGTGKFKEDWKVQLCIYGWMLGKFGTEFLGTIHQISYNGKEKIPTIAILDVVIDVEFQNRLIRELKGMWNKVHKEPHTVVRPFIKSNLIPDYKTFLQLIQLKSEGESWF